MANLLNILSGGGQNLLDRIRISLKQRRGAAMLVNMVIVGLMMGLMATSFAQLSSAQFSNLTAYRTGLQAYQLVEAKANEIGVTSYSALAAEGRATVTGASPWQREVQLGAPVALGGGGTQRTVTINVYYGAETSPRATINKYPTSAGTASGVPAGVIAIWRGSAATIPSGWVLCDGTNGTPDLRSRFVYGAGGDANTKASVVTGWNTAANGHWAIGYAGGEEYHYLTVAEMPNHTHSAWTDGQGNHNHGQFFGTYGHRGDLTPPTPTMRILVDDDVPYAGLAWSSDTNYAGYHGHNVGIGATGGNGGFNFFPRFITLAYIMKT